MLLEIKFKDGKELIINNITHFELSDDLVMFHEIQWYDAWSSAYELNKIESIFLEGVRKFG